MRQIIFPLLLLILLSGCASQRAGITAADDQTIDEQEAFTTDLLAEDSSDEDTPDILQALSIDDDPEHTTLSAEDIGATDSDSEASMVSEDLLSLPEDAEETAAASSDHDLWERIRRGYKILGEDNKHIAAERNWYAKHQEYLDRTAERATPYLYLIVEEIERRNIPTEIALLPIVESAFQPFAYSHGRAAGLWQFIPGTGKHYGLKQNWWYDGRRDVEASTKAALDYLQSLHDSFDGDWLLALAAYNSGQGTVVKAIRKNKHRGRPTDFWSLQLPKETRAYVPKLLAISSIVANPAEYAVNLKPIPDEPYLARVDIGSQIDMATAAELADIPLDELYRLNPAFNRWATDPDGPHALLLPVNSVDRFQQQLAELPSEKRIQWQRHRIRDGETLGHIALKYKTTPAVLRQVNNLRGNFIRAGHNLLIPVATRDISSYSLSAEQRRRSIQNTSKSGIKITYIVRNGDTLWDIARKYDITVSKLAKWNGMAPRDMLRPGQKLVLWWSEPKAETAKTLGISPLATDSLTRRVNYTVRKGDSLARISQRFKVSVNDLVQWNSLSKSKYLQPGQKLTLFVDITQQAENI